MEPRSHRPGQSFPGQLVDPTGTQTWARVPTEQLVDPQAFKPRPKLPGTICLNLGNTDPSPGHPGELVDPGGPRTLYRVARDNLSIPPALVHGPVSHGTAGQLRGPLDKSASCLGELVTMPAFVHGPESPRADGLPCGPWYMGQSSMGQLVDTEDPRSLARVTQKSWLTPQAFRQVRKPSGTAGRPHGNSNPDPSPPGYLVDPSGLGAEPEAPGKVVYTANPRTRPRVTQESWSTPQAIRHGPDSSGRAGQHRVPSDMGLFLPGQLVDTAGTRTWARGTRDCWSPTQAFGRGPESPGTGGRPCGTSDPGTIHPGQMVNTAVPRNRVQVTRQK